MSEKQRIYTYAELMNRCMPWLETEPNQWRRLAEDALESLRLCEFQANRLQKALSEASDRDSDRCDQHITHCPYFNPFTDPNE